MSALYAGLTVFVLTAAGAMALYVAIYGSNRPFDERISDLGVKMRVTYGNPLGLDVESDTFARSLFRWVAKRLPEPPISSKEGEKLAQTLVRAGFPGSRALRVFHFTRLAITAGLAFGLLALSLTLGYRGIKPLLFMLMGAGAGGFVPGYYLARRARKRQQEIANQLSDVLDLLVVCVEAGLGLNEAIKVVGSETQRQKQQIGSELAMVSAELGAGSSLGTALRAFADRTAVDDIKPLAATLVQSEKLGAQIGPALRSLSDSLRTSRRLRAEEAAAKTTVKILFPLVFFILPAMMSVIIGPAMIQIMQTLNK
jgi:tight adherence protein C